MRTTWHRGRAPGGERGTALIEFALIFPIFMMLVLGMFSGGQTYNRKLTLTNASREASRYGATLPVSNFASLDAWLASVADLAEQNATGDLSSGVSGRSICVAYVYPDGTAATPNDRTKRLIRTTGDAYSLGDTCFTDTGLPINQRRVQVRVTRPSSIRGVFFTIDVTLAANSLTRFEAT